MAEGKKRLDEKYAALGDDMGRLMNGLTGAEFSAVLKYLRGATGILAAQAKNLCSGG